MGVAIRALLTVVALLGGATCYAFSLCAIRVSIALVSLTVRRPISQGSQSNSAEAAATGAAVTALWIAVLFGALRVLEWPTLPVLGPVGLALSVVIGWQVSAWRQAVIRAQRPGCLPLGRERHPAFGISRPYAISAGERRKHVAIEGATGSGKTSLLRHLIVSDIKRGAGLCLIDPKDDLVDSILGHVPQARENDVILLDATDTERPLGFNPLDGVPIDRRSLAAGEVVAVFRRYFSDSWGARLEYLLTNAVLALLEVPKATLLDLRRLFIDQEFRQEVAAQVTNPGVRQFFMAEYDQITRNRGDAIGPILNKIGPWHSYAELRNVIGQRTSSFEMRRVMDQGKILLVRIPQGRLGEDVSSLLGALISAKVQLAAQSRVDTPAARRRPFYLYVDEFQNFATSSFTRILTDARGFNLGLICANQYREQLAPPLREAIERNVGTSVLCRSDGTDYRLEIQHRGAEGDDHTVMLVPPYPLHVGESRQAKRIRARSRAVYGRPRESVELDLFAPASLFPTVVTASSGPKRQRRSSTGRRDIDEE